MLIVYSKNNCPECAKAMALLDAKWVPYIVFKVEDDPNVREFLLAMGHRSVPQIYEDSQDRKYIGDFKALTKLTDSDFEALKQS